MVKKKGFIRLLSMICCLLLSAFIAVAFIGCNAGTKTETKDDEEKIINVQSITVAPVSLSMGVGETAQLTAVISPSNATDKTLKWETTNAAVASVDSKGNVTAKSKGNAVIKVSSSNEFVATCSVNVIVKTGTIEGTITYKYNNYIGNKPDVGARLFLIPTNIPKKSIEYADLITSGIILSDKRPAGLLQTETDGNGKYKFNQVPVGEYFLLVRSHETNTHLDAGYSQGSLLSIWDYLNAVSESTKESRIEQKIEVFDKIVVSENDALTYSHDFGITYI